MKRSVLLQPNVIKWLTVSIIIACSQIQTVAETSQPSPSVTEFTVKTCDGLLFQLV